METIGQRVRRRRKDLQMTQEQLASRAGIIQGTVSAIERDATSKPLGPTLLRLAAALECSPHWLQTGEGEVKIQSSVLSQGELEKYVAALDDQQRHMLLAVAKTLFNK